MYKCTTCNHVQETKPPRGNTIVEIILWVIFLFIFLPIPLIYSLWRHLGSKVKCPHCKHKVLFVPFRAEKPMVGAVKLTEQSFVDKFNNSEEAAKEFHIESKKFATSKLTIVIGIIFAIIAGAALNISKQPNSDSQSHLYKLINKG